MKCEYKVAMHRELCAELNDTFAKKNADYGDSFGDLFDKLGLTSALVRLSDKYNRLMSLGTKPEAERKVLDESIEDTLMDMANYALMTVLELRMAKAAAESKGGEEA